MVGPPCTGSVVALDDDRSDTVCVISRQEVTIRPVDTIITGAGGYTVYPAELIMCAGSTEVAEDVDLKGSFPAATGGGLNTSALDDFPNGAAA